MSPRSEGDGSRRACQHLNFKKSGREPAVDLHKVSLGQVLAQVRRELQHVDLGHREDGLERTSTKKHFFKRLDQVLQRRTKRLRCDAEGNLRGERNSTCRRAGATAQR